MSARFQKEDWLKLAGAQLTKYGPAALTIERMTEVACRTRGSFYHHFSSREDFLAAFMDWWWEASMGTLTRRLQTAKTLTEKQAVLRDVALEWDGELERNIRRLAAFEPSVQARLRAIDEQRIKGLESMIRLLRPDIEDPYSFAFVQYASVVGGQWLLDSRDDPRIPNIRRVGNSIFGLGEE